MRKSSPQHHQTPKGPDKPSSPRLTLRFQPIKSRDDRHGGAFKASEVTSSEPRYQSYCVTMESAEDVYEFKKDDAPTMSSTRSSSSTPDSDPFDHHHHHHQQQQLNVVSSSKDLHPAAAPLSSSLRLFVPHGVGSAADAPSRELGNSRGAVRTSDNHAAAPAHPGAREKHKVAERGGVEVADGDVVAAPKGHANKNNGESGGSSNHVRTADVDDVSEGEHDDGKRKRKRDSREEAPTAAVTAAAANSKAGHSVNSGIAMSLRNHSREKGVVVSPEERKSPQEASSGAVAAAALATVAASSSTTVKPSVHASGSETESMQSDGEHEAPEGGGTGVGIAPGGQEQSHGLPKVPPLKIVIPPTSLAEQDRDRSRLASRHSLPYVVNSSSGGEPLDCKADGNGGGCHPPASDSGGGSSSNSNKDSPSKDDAKLPRDGHSEERSHRVTRSSQRMAAMASATVSLTSLQNLPDYVSSVCGSQSDSSSGKAKYEQGDGSAEEQNGPDMPPRKRKLRPRDGTLLDGSSVGHSSASSSSSSSVSSHCEDQSMFLNCYEMYLNLRRQIDRRRTSMFVVQPKPPQGFKDYLMNKCSYVLEGNAASRLSVPMIPPPQSLPGSMKELYMIQEKARYDLRLQHIIEREKLTLSFEQETLRVHGRAARAMANQTVPLSVCTILKDEEVYNQIEPEQEEKERNARTRYNGRLFLSWIQDVDDKWDKVKKAMLLRHHNEAESLHAAQKLDWEWKMKELGICDSKSTPVIDVIHVPIVHVSDDFDLLPV